MASSRLQVGIDVPWVTSWSAEVMAGVGPCSTVLGRLALSQLERPGDGKPQYSQNHLRRQRQSVRDMLCPMCGAPTASNDRWTLTARRATLGALRSRAPQMHAPADIPDDRIVIDAGAIAPLHRTCLDRSLTHCPHLRGRDDTEAMAFPATWLVAPLMAEPPAPAAYLAAPLAQPVIAFLQIIGLTEERDAGGRRRADTKDRPQEAPGPSH